MNITWKRCLTYASAKASEKVVYLHEWNGAPFYWGLAANFDTRYNVGYSHWIEGCLQHGGRLYVGKPDKDNMDGFSLEDIENTLIAKYGSVMNKKLKASKVKEITHSGNVPESIEKPGVP